MTATRQVRRQEDRQNAKTARAAYTRAFINERKRALLDRQSRREKAGFYESRIAVGKVRAPSRSRLDTRIVQKGKPFGRILRTVTAHGVERQYHATKGIRTYRATA